MVTKLFSTELVRIANKYNIGTDRLIQWIRFNAPEKGNTKDAMNLILKFESDCKLKKVPDAYGPGDYIVLLNWDNVVTTVRKMKDGDLYFVVPGYKGAYLLKDHLSDIRKATLKDNIQTK